MASPLSRMLAAGPIETRQEEHEEEPDLGAAVAAVEELRNAVEDHRTATDERLSTELRSLTERLDGLETRLQRPAAHDNRTREEQADERRAFTGFLKHGKESLEPDEVRALRVSDDTAGGYLAPAEFSTEVIRLLTEFSPVRQAARVGQTGSASVVLPKRTSITNAQWEGETEASTASEPAFAQVEIPVHNLRTYTDVSQQLLEDSTVNVEAELADAFAQDFAKKEGTAFVSGTGVKQPRGILVHPDLTTYANGHATTLKVDGIIGIFHELPAAYRNRGVWMMNSTTLGEIRKLKDTDGTYLWRAALAEGNPATILGRPVVEAVDMPDIGSNELPILFGDFNNGYRIYDRLSVAVLRDPYTQATNSLVRFHARRRVGGDLVNAEAIRALKMTT